MGRIYGYRDSISGREDGVRAFKKFVINRGRILLFKSFFVFKILEVYIYFRVGSF